MQFRSNHVKRSEGYSFRAKKLTSAVICGGFIMHEGIYTREPLETVKHVSNGWET